MKCSVTLKIMGLNGCVGKGITLICLEGDLSAIKGGIAKKPIFMDRLMVGSIEKSNVNS